MDDAFGNWLAGFADGEGCFTITRRGKGGSHVPQFRIAVRFDDQSIIEEIVDRTGAGTIYHGKMRVNKHGTHHPQVDWIVCSKADIATLISIFDRYPLRAKKARDYAIWRRASLLWINRTGHRGTSGREPHPMQATLADLKRQLEEGRQVA